MADDRRQSLQGSPALSGCAGRKPRNEAHQRGLNTKLHLAVGAFGMPVRIIATEGTRADCAEAASLIEGIDAEPLIANKGCDSDAIIRQARSQGLQAQIPPRKNRKEPRDHDKPLYRQRHPVENAF
jgi:IS5 family transposase